ncbi:lipopolysaccharide biosynthesis protein [Archaeoglobus sp.]
MRRSLSFYTLFFVASLALMKLSGVLSKMIVARFVTPYEYGIITLVTISLPSMFLYFTNFCFHEMLSNSKEGKNFFGFSIFYSATASIVVGLLVLFFHSSVFSFLNLPLDWWKILFVAFFISLFSISILNDVTGLFRGLKLYSSTSIIASLPALLKLSTVLAILISLKTLDFLTVLMIFSFSSLIALVVVLVRYHRTISANLSILSPNRDILFFGTSIYILGLFGGLSQTISKIIVSHDLGIIWQGYFDASLTVISILSFAFASMSFISIPEATSSSNREELLYETGRLGDVVRALFAFLVLGVLLFCIYPYQFVGLLFGEDYAVSSRFLPVLAVGYIFLYVQQFLAYLNVSFQNPSEYRSLVVATVICLAAITILLHGFTMLAGILGTYSVLSFFYFIYLLITLKFSKDSTPIRVFLRKIHMLVVSTTITALLLYFIKFPNFLLGVVFASIIFTTLVFATGYLDRSLIKGIFSREGEKEGENN